MKRRKKYFTVFDDINLYPYGGQTDPPLTDNQQMVMADIMASPKLLFTPEYTDWRRYIMNNSPEYLDRLWNNLSPQEKDDVYNNNYKAFSAISNKAKGEYGASKVRRNSNEVAPYVVGGLAATAAAPFLIGEAAPFIADVAAPAVGTALEAFGNTVVGRALSSTPARIAYGLAGANNLVSEDGFAKTQRLYREGDYLGAMKSGAGDFANLLFVADGAVQGAKALYNAPVIGQFPRYIGGKFKYGFDAELPMLYRKLRGVVPEVENGKVTFTNTPTRFQYKKTGEDPRITNFTTDAPVRAHQKGKWYDTDVFAIDGKSLLGKKVVSTRPSDTFTYDDLIRTKASNTHYLTGNPERLAEAKAAGYKVHTSERLQNEYNKAESAYRQALKEQAKRNEGRRIKFNGVKEEYYFPEYARALEYETRNLFRSPTKKDYEFMDYVFRPEYKSEVIDNIQSPFYIETMEQYPKLGEWYHGPYSKEYLTDPTRWQNVMYDPATNAEYLWREANGVDAKY